jgi:phage terminase small subunit
LRSPRIEAFIAAYAGTGNATQAAVRAGYSRATAKQQGCRLLKRQDVTARLHEHRSEMDRRHAQDVRSIEIEGERTRQVLAALCYFDPRAIVREDGSPKGLHELDPWTAASIADFEVVESYSGEAENRRKVVTTKVRFLSRTTALDMAARILGLYAPTRRGVDAVRAMSDEELRSRALALMSPKR